MPPSRGMPDAGDGLPGGAPAALVQVQAAGLDVPVPGGDEPARGQPGPGGADLPAQRGAGVLHLQGRGAAQERDRHRLRRRPTAAAASLMGVLLCWRCHWSTSMITSACRASINCARFPVAMRILNRTLSPPGRSPSAHIIADHAPIRRYSRQITITIFPALPRLFSCHLPLSSRPLCICISGAWVSRARPRRSTGGPSRHRRPPAGVHAARRRSRWSPPPEERP